jgi:hypothetical protein
MSVDLQFPRASPNTADMLNRVKYDVSRDVNCHLICKIESIDAAKNTVTCSSAFKRRMSNDNELEYPLFVDVPLFVLSGGGCSLFIPPKAGDWCILMFNDRDIDDWWYSGEVRAPSSARAHSLSDGIAIVGIRPQSNPLQLALDAVTLNALELPVNIKNQDCEIAINAGITLDAKAKPFMAKTNDCEMAINAGITLDGKAKPLTAKTNEGSIKIDGKIEIDAKTKKVSVKNSANNMKAVLEAMLDQLQSAISAGLTPGAPGSGPAPAGTPLVFPTLAVAITTAKTQIGTLLE